MGSTSNYGARVGGQAARCCSYGDGGGGVEIWGVGCRRRTARSVCSVGASGSFLDRSASARLLEPCVFSRLNSSRFPLFCITVFEITRVHHIL